ncbi:unnamed protein product [Durusdinium trenchii]|uniref:Uncharacterized protein n=1 Tax=Durusdinium trenchii TaxID=1381693 RepID=A0ABP0LEP1_9DINO
MSPMSPRSPSSRQPDGPRLPFLQSGEAIEFLGRVKFVEDQLGARMRIRRQRAAARCLLVVLRSWHPFAIQRMMRHIAACVKRLQQFLHRAVLRLKATRIMVKAQMVQIERELVEKDTETKNPIPPAVVHHVGPAVCRAKHRRSFQRMMRKRTPPSVEQRSRHKSRWDE